MNQCKKIGVLYFCKRTMEVHECVSLFDYQPGTRFARKCEMKRSSDDRIFVYSVSALHNSFRRFVDAH